ncbi:MAG: cytidine deaminase [Candidatus Heimdallarchaeota archaeon]|nr:cytidine deaminase [Candidatus Heimdallarchaeota archaeon]
MSEEETTLIKEAIKAREFAYAPYSGFKVGAALLTESGIIRGCNVENISFSPTICAERNAIFSAISQGITSFKSLAVVTGDTKPSEPCGVCRQVLSEFVTGNFKIILSNTRGDLKIFTLDDLLPYRFKPVAGIGDSDTMWELLEDVIFADDVMSEDELKIVKNVMQNIEEFDSFLKYAERDGHISANEKFIIEKFREKVYDDAYKVAKGDEIITEEEERLLQRLAEILKLE